MSSNESPQQFGDLVETLVGTVDEIRNERSVQDEGGADPVRIECTVNLVWESDAPQADVEVNRTGSDDETGGTESIAQPSDRDGATRTNGRLPGKPEETNANPFECPAEHCTREFDSRHGLRIHHSKVHEDTPARKRNGESGDTDDSLYKDPDVLEEIYDETKSFGEMTAELDVDVSPSTVRRHMINFGIHQPSSYDTSTDDATEADRTASTSEQSDSGAPTETETETDDAADRSGSETESIIEGSSAEHRPTGDITEIHDTDLDLLAEREPIPQSDCFRKVLQRFDIEEDLDREELKRAVRDSETLYETSRKLNVDREKIKKLLLELDLLDVVFGRLEEKERREVSTDEIEERINTTVANTAM